MLKRNPLLCLRIPPSQTFDEILDGLLHISMLAIRGAQDFGRPERTVVCSGKRLHISARLGWFVWIGYLWGWRVYNFWCFTLIHKREFGRPTGLHLMGHLVCMCLQGKKKRKKRERGCTCRGLYCIIVRNGSLVSVSVYAPKLFYFLYFV